MGISYLQNRPWSSWTRDERFFCSVLYSYAAKDPDAFAAWLIAAAKLSARRGGEWELGYEVCFYRDFFWHQERGTARASGLPAKRTFDLCLFGERDIIIVEAKVCEPFDATQNAEFAKDRVRIGAHPDLKDLNVHLVALASSRYFGRAIRPTTLAMFDGRVTWSAAATKFGDRLLAQAERMYGLKPGELLREPA